MTGRGFLKMFDRRLGISNRLRGLPASGFDLRGEKVLDWSWCLANLPHLPSQRILEIGCAQSPVGAALASMGHEVIGIDIERVPYELPGFAFYQADFLDFDFDNTLFDVIIGCSVVEHIGLVGRYGQRDIPNGDLQAMRKVATLLKSSGILILTIPVGKDMVYAPWHRVYGPERLPRLLEGFIVEKESFFVKEPRGLWWPAERTMAFRVDRNGLSYGLGQFLLRSPGVRVFKGQQHG